VLFEEGFNFKITAHDEASSFEPASHAAEGDRAIAFAAILSEASAALVADVGTFGRVVTVFAGHIL
jgi:hypothetical protein